MSAYAIAFKAEVARMVRKEVKDEIISLRKASTAHKSELVQLRRELKEMATTVKTLSKALKSISPATATAPDAPAAETGQGKRTFVFNAEALAAKRAALGLTQKDMATLLGASSLSVWKWESDRVVPRAAQLSRIRAVLKLGKREALAMLQAQAEQPI